jgi:hypothetical protein
MQDCYGFQIKLTELRGVAIESITVVLGGEPNRP